MPNNFVHKTVSSPNVQTAPLPVQNSLDSIRNLIFLGYMEREIDILGFKIKLRTLTNAERNEILLNLTALNDMHARLSIDIAYLSYSIVTVNGMPIELLYSGEEDVTPREKKVKIISQFQQALVDRLASEYDKLDSDSKRLLSEDKSEEIKK